MRITAAEKAAWIADLRSGEFTQTFGVLHRPVDAGPNRPIGYCCLGVLSKRLNGEIYAEESEGYRSVYDLTGANLLVGLNDDRRLSFPAIADWIEENVTTDG